jgi:hypothetical protein
MNAVGVTLMEEGKPTDERTPSSAKLQKYAFVSFGLKRRLFFQIEID